MTQATRHHLFDTALGVCGVAWSERGLAGVQLPEKDRETTERRLAAKSGSAGVGSPPPWIAALVMEIQKYLAGEQVDFSSVAVDFEGIDEDRRRLYAALRNIGFGRTVTYGELAKEIGLTGWEGARDVGVAMGRNPVPIVVPCHRVLAAGNKLGGFSAYGGTSTKQKLLALEGVNAGDAPKRRAEPKRKPEPPRLPGF